MSALRLASSKVTSGITTPSDSVLMRIFSSAFSRLVSRKRRMSGWWAFRYTAPAPCRAPSWLAYENESSSSFITGTTPDDWFSMPLMGAPSSRRLVSISATPPPRLESCSAELMARPMLSMLSSTRSRKHEISSPRLFLPALRKVGVAGWNRPLMISSMKRSASCSSPRASVSATITTRSSKRSR